MTENAWSALEAAAAHDARIPIPEMFAREPDRLKRMTVTAAGLYLDLSKQAWSGAGLDAALALALSADVEGKRRAFFGGEAINRSEGRAVLHPALRAADGAAFHADGRKVSPLVEESRAAMRAFADAVRSGAIAASDGKPFTAVLHIGIGGSDLGPRMVWQALKPLKPAMDLAFVANVDPSDIAAATASADTR